MSSNRPVITTSKLTTTVVANGSKPGDNSIPMIEVNKNEEEEPLMVEGAPKKDNTNGKDIVMVYPELVPIMDNNDDHHETHF